MIHSEIILLFTVSIIASGLTSNFYKKISQQINDNIYSLIANIVWMLPLSVIFFLITIISKDFSIKYETIFIAFPAGLMIAISAFMLLESLRRGSYTVAIIIMNMNFYIPILLSRIFLNESATLLQLVGIFIVTVVIIAINTGGINTKDDKTGIILACIASIANGSTNFCIKLQQYNTPSEEINTFYFLLYFFAALCCIIAVILKKVLVKDVKINPIKIKPIITPALLLGFCVAVCLYPQSILSSNDSINASAQFTITITGSLILALLIGWIKYKEKFNIKSIVSLILCITAIIFQVVSS